MDYSTTNSDIFDEKVSKGYLFIALIWLAFLLPVTAWSAFPFIIGHTNLSELAIIAMPFVYSLYPRNNEIWSSATHSHLRKAILLFFTSVILVNFSQYFFYGGRLSEYFLANRPLIPLFASLALIYFGPRINTKLLVINLCLCLFFSFIISLAFFFLEIGFKPFFYTELDEEAFEIVRQGRLYNVNGAFSFLALGISYGIIKHKEQINPKWLRYVILLCALFSIFVAVLAFNRTFLAIAILFFIYLIIRHFNLQTNTFLMLVAILSISLSYYAYSSDFEVRSQVDRRIFIPLESREALLSSVYYNNRDVLYMDYLDAAKKYSYIGVPPNDILSERIIAGRSVSVNVSDVSLITVLFRFGTLSLIIYLFVFVCYYRYVKNMFLTNTNGLSNTLCFSILVVLPFMFMASFNIDILARHYSVLFIALLTLAITKHSIKNLQ